MICTNTDHYVNTLSTIKKEKKKKERAMIKKLGKLQGHYFKIRELHLQKADHPKTSLKC